MSDGLENIVASLAVDGAYISRVSKGSTVITSTVANNAVTLPRYPFLNRDYNIRVNMTANPVGLFSGTGLTDNTTAIINSLAAGAPLILPQGCSAVARCISKAYTTGNTWTVNISAMPLVVRLPAGDVVLTEAYSGCTIILNTSALLAATTTITLPAVAKGGVYHFKKTTDSAGTGEIIIAGGVPNGMAGNIMNFSGAVPLQIPGGGAVQRVNFLPVSTPGSYITVMGNGLPAGGGLGWYVEGVTVTLNAAGAGASFT